jgi:hypothetical protein
MLLKQSIASKEDAVNRFISRHRDVIRSVLSGFDRLVFRGTLQPLMHKFGMFHMLERAGVRLLDFKEYVSWASESLKQASLAEAHRAGRPVVSLQSSRVSKEELARKILAQSPVKSGLICVLSTVEPCMSFEYHRSQDKDERGLRLRPRKCLHLYKYYLDPTFGFMNARIQTWFPFNIQVCMNGRMWVARQLERRHSPFVRVDNCFTSIGNPDLAQRLMDEQLATDWPQALTAIARKLNPIHENLFWASPMDYYWSAYQTEWATDILFKDPAMLAAIYPGLVRHATEHFKSPDVMRFLAQKAPGNFTGEIVSSFKDRAEGVRVKHWIRGNSLKMYDKFGNLRAECTIGCPNDFKVLRPHHDDPDSKLEWRPLRKGVADLHRRAQVSQRANDAYLDALAVVDDTTPASTLFDSVSRQVTYDGRKVRALRLGDPQDLSLLQGVARGEFAISGFRNKDIRQLLYPTAASTSTEQVRKQSSKTGRLLRLLRAHGIIRKINKTQRYRLTEKGRLLAAALFAARTANIQKLLAIAA